MYKVKPFYITIYIIQKFNNIYAYFTYSCIHYFCIMQICLHNLKYDWSILRDCHNNSDY